MSEPAARRVAWLEVVGCRADRHAARPQALHWGERPLLWSLSPARRECDKRWDPAVPRSLSTRTGNLQAGLQDAPV
jgi:hypothetical protein